MLCAICVPLLLCYDVVMIVVVFGCYSSTLEYAARIPTGPMFTVDIGVLLSCAVL